MAFGLSGLGIPASTDSWTGEGLATGNPISQAAAYDPRITFGTGWSSAVANFFGGNFINSNGATTQLTFTPANAFDTIEVYHAPWSSGTSFDTSIDAGATLGSTNTNSATTILAKATFTVPLGTHTVKITPSTTAAVYVQGINCYNSANKAIDVFIGAFGGATSTNWTDASQNSTCLNALAFFAPDLTIINLGINDEINSIATATTKSNLQTIGNTAKISGDVFLNMHTPANAAGNLANQAATETAYSQLAATNNWALVDWLQRYVSWTQASNAGLMYDQYHPNATMYAQMGNYLAEILKAV
jgi:lysophospholipase L1-like esterase